MNRLKKKAKKEFIARGICTLITIPLFLALAHTNAKGLYFLFIWVLVGVPTGLGLYLWETKKLKQFDEREREIIQKAFSISMMAFTLYLLTFCLAAFFMIGGGGRNEHPKSSRGASHVGSGISRSLRSTEKPAKKFRVNSWSRPMP